MSKSKSVSYNIMQDNNLTPDMTSNECKGEKITGYFCGEGRVFAFSQQTEAEKLTLGRKIEIPDNKNNISSECHCVLFVNGKNAKVFPRPPRARKSTERCRFTSYYITCIAIVCDPARQKYYDKSARLRLFPFSHYVTREFRPHTSKKYPRNNNAYPRIVQFNFPWEKCILIGGGTEAGAKARGAQLAARVT